MAGVQEQVVWGGVDLYVEGEIPHTGARIDITSKVESIAVSRSLNAASRRPVGMRDNVIALGGRDNTCQWNFKAEEDFMNDVEDVFDGIYRIKIMVARYGNVPNKRKLEWEQVFTSAPFNIMEGAPELDFSSAAQIQGAITYGTI